MKRFIYQEERIKMVEELRKEAERLVDEYENTEKSILKLFEKGIIPDFNKVQKLYNKREELRNQYTKLYEMIGKLGM